jgi:predicted ArsR family transcriptional regulator
VRRQDCQFAEVGLRFRVTIRTVSVAEPSGDDVDRTILEYLADPIGHSTAEVAAHIGLATRATQRRLARLKDRGLVSQSARARDPRRRWHGTRSSD